MGGFNWWQQPFWVYTLWSTWQEGAKVLIIMHLFCPYQNESNQPPRDARSGHGGTSLHRRPVSKFGRDSWQHIFPPCHTYSVAVTSSAIKDSSTNNVTLFMITTAPTTLDCCDWEETNRTKTAHKSHHIAASWRKNQERIQTPVVISVPSDDQIQFLGHQTGPVSSHSNISLHRAVSGEQVLMSHT